MRSSPSSRTDPAALLSELGALPFAHRGLHGGSIVENSRAAFKAAIARGHGVELDVQASRDAHAFVFHDQRLERLGGRSGAVAELVSDDLELVRLSGTGETVPRLEEILRLIAGRVPLLIEVKSPGGGVAALCRSVARALEGYKGSAGVMSFNPEVARWFAAHAPSRLRGLVVTEQDRGGTRGRVARRLALWWARPHFLACDIRDLPSSFADRARSRGIAIFTWTVRTPSERARAAAYAHQIIYEDRP